MDKPLALKLIPKTLNDVIGQKHLIGKDMVLTNLVKNKKLFSMILYGNPGIGKTSIALALVNDLSVRYRMLNATINNKKDFDTVVEEAKMYDGIVLIMDEIHRLNKDKQDLLLPFIENGLITLIGMTTANPYHSINPAIRSRCQLFKLNDLEETDILEGLNKAIKSEFLKDIKIDKEAIIYIAKISGTDLRFAYNLLEVSYYATSGKIKVNDVKKINSKPSFLIDKNSDGYYDVLSAFQKSIRGSDVNASLHYLARLITMGDLDSICRRLSVIAYEDVGLANVNVVSHVMNAIDAATLVGFPEARIPLGTIVVELALSPKSNTAHIALDEALKDIETINTGTIPKHLKNPSSEYKYPHNYKDSYVIQQYLPDIIKDKKYYFPKSLGSEVNFKKTYENIEKLQEKNIEI